MKYIHNSHNITFLDFERIYDRLEIRNLIERGESFYQSRMNAIVKELDERGKMIIKCQLTR